MTNRIRAEPLFFKIAFFSFFTDLSKILALPPKSHQGYQCIHSIFLLRTPAEEGEDGGGRMSSNQYLLGLVSAQKLFSCVFLFDCHSLNYARVSLA